MKNRGTKAVQRADVSVNAKSTSAKMYLTPPYPQHYVYPRTYEFGMRDNNMFLRYGLSWKDSVAQLTELDMTIAHQPVIFLKHSAQLIPGIFQHHTYSPRKKYFHCSSRVTNFVSAFNSYYLYSAYTDAYLSSHKRQGQVISSDKKRNHTLTLITRLGEGRLGANEQTTRTG